MYFVNGVLHYTLLYRRYAKVSAFLHSAHAAYFIKLKLWLWAGPYFWYSQAKRYIGGSSSSISGNLPVGTYLQKLRVDEAARLLRETDKTVTEIAELSGFGDVKSFYTVFKREMDVTPGEYRGRG